MSLKSLAKRVVRPAYVAALNLLPLSVAARLDHLRGVGRWPDLKNPKTFNEKIHWRKFHGDFETYARLADKVAVKEHVRGILGEAFIIPTLWAGKSLPPIEERNWPIPFVIKANNSSATNYFVQEQDDLDWPRIEALCRYWLYASHPRYTGERHYPMIEPRILIEPFLGKNLNDYKFYVFHGRVRCIHVDTNRFSGHKRCFYDRDWILMPFSLKYPRETREIERPIHLDAMIAAVEMLGADWDFVRVDFYDLPEGPKFGEMTFMPGNGSEVFNPAEYDRILGKYWQIES